MLIKTWFSLISAILIISLINVVLKFELSNIFHWISLIFLIITSSLTLIVYFEKNNSPNEKTYSEFLKQKDKIIEELRHKNHIMFKTAMKKAEQKLK